jgi:hypothetical protein
MSDKARSAYEAWNEADVQARQAEARLGIAWQAYFDGKGRAPEAELIHEVARLRAAANDRLSVAMATINSQRGRDHPR